MTISPTNACSQPANDSMLRLEQLAGEFGEVIATEPITGSGSNRRYFRFRFADGSTMIGCLGTNVAENQAFIGLARYFRERLLPVPEIIAVSDDSMAYLQQDLGSTSLLDCISDEEMVARTMEMLPKFQLNGAIGLDFSQCYPVSELDRRSVMWDLNYFKYCFLKPMGVEIDEPRLEDEFELLAERIVSARPLGFMVRDFQSRNVMVHDGQPWLIDFQGGRRGPVHYDVASFLWQSRAGFSDETRRQMIDRYIDTAGVSRESFLAQLPDFVAFRMMQVLGAYGFRGLYERKPAFMTQIPASLHSLRMSLNPNSFPYLSKLTEDLAFSIDQRNQNEDGALTVEVMSFSYKKGMPADSTDNGGGFTFDCRAIHNPGRYERYRALTGRDPEVIEFLENDGEITQFLEHCYSLVDASVERYLERGFTHLQVAFGCTGGRHRSLYSADHMAEHLRQRFAGQNLRVTLHHREQPQLEQ